MLRSAIFSILDYMMPEFRNCNPCYSCHEWISAFPLPLSRKSVLCPL